MFVALPRLDEHLRKAAEIFFAGKPSHGKIYERALRNHSSRPRPSTIEPLIVFSATSYTPLLYVESRTILNDLFLDKVDNELRSVPRGIAGISGPATTENARNITFIHPRYTMEKEGKTPADIRNTDRNKYTATFLL